MQQHVDIPDFIEITPTAPVSTTLHGGRAKCLQRLVRLDLPVPKTVAISFPGVRSIAAGNTLDMDALMGAFGPAPLLSVRPSSLDPDWGGPGAILNIGMNAARHAELTQLLGHDAADTLYRRFVQAYATHVARLDPDIFDEGDADADIAGLLEAYEDDADEPFPQDPSAQLAGVLGSMARAWEGTTARLLRQAKGAPADAGLGLVVQAMAAGLGPPESGSGVIQFIDPSTGDTQITGRYLSQSQGRDAVGGADGALYLTRDPRGPSLEELAPEVFETLKTYGSACRTRLREEMQIEFTIQAGKLWVLDAVRVQRSARAGLKIAVELAEAGIIQTEDAVLRIEPRALSELLHGRVDPEQTRDVMAKGIAASPGASTGRIVFTSRAAQASAAREEPCILVRRETSPEDIRGMHAAVGVLTERGGTTSHAAVIARGLGLPCVVGASGLRLNRREKTLVADDGRVFREGDVITLDGSDGVALAGEAKLLEPALDGAFRTLLSWADDARDIGVRVNADTAAEARMARAFEAEGIGLCRTEHMFFDEERLTVMREMIFADKAEDRAAVLDRLLPMQRADFLELFRTMAGLPVCIRLLDPPLHEFLPSGREGLRDLADALDLPMATVTRRVEALTEFNPMLGMRGVRLGIALPEIYDMQARAIFEATVEGSRPDRRVVPEIMIPLVSARREVELVKTRVDAVAAAVRVETGAHFDYRLGVMVETPRAALRSDEIAQHASFLSFGTNDLTQMAYGLSRDDAGRFMNSYVGQGVFPEDPFHRLDVEGVGELLTIGAERGRRGRPDVVLSVCGEHGGDPESIAFCRQAGFDYVSCSPFRVPVARLAAAHLAIRSRKSGETIS
ncbi:MAG: putative PEP-binding protein [Pseudomonadota bacterium]